MPTTWNKAQEKAARTARWAVTMSKVRIRRVLSRTRWQLVSFHGRAGSESAGIVDLLAIRKDHSGPRRAMKRGDALQMILIQVKGGTAPMPKAQDTNRLVAVANWHRARQVVLASWKKGRAAQFYELTTARKWRKVQDLRAVFH